MLAAIIQKQQKLHTFPSNTTNVKTDLHLPQQQTARIVQIVYSSDSRKKRENVGALQWNRLSNHIRKCFCFQLCQAADKGLYRTKCLQLSEHHRVVSNWNMGVHEVTHCAQLHWAPCPAQSTTFSKHAVRLERTSALCTEDKIECGNITFWGKTKNWMAAKSIRTQEEAPEKEGPEQELHLDSTAEPNHRLDVLEKPYGTRVEGPAMQLQVLQLKPILTIKFPSRSITADKRIHTLWGFLPRSEERLTLSSQQQTSLLNLWNGDLQSSTQYTAPSLNLRHNPSKKNLQYSNSASIWSWLNYSRVPPRLFELILPKQTLKIKHPIYWKSSFQQSMYGAQRSDSINSSRSPTKQNVASLR